MQLIPLCHTTKNELIRMHVCMPCGTRAFPRNSLAHSVTAEGRGERAVLGDNMKLTVRLRKLFYESSNGVPALLPCSRQPRQARGTLRKLFT